jgi:hypothetical protein
MGIPEEGLDLLPRGNELVAGDGVLEAGHGHAAGDTLVQVLLEDPKEEK